MKITQATQAGSASQIMQTDSKARTRRARTTERSEGVRPYA